MHTCPCPPHPAQAGDLKSKFKPYSKFPPCYKDMAFWVSPEFTENNLCELVGPGGVPGGDRWHGPPGRFHVDGDCELMSALLRLGNWRALMRG